MPNGPRYGRPLIVLVASVILSCSLLATASILNDSQGGMGPWPARCINTLERPGEMMFGAWLPLGILGSFVFYFGIFWAVPVGWGPVVKSFNIVALTGSIVLISAVGVYIHADATKNSVNW
jgi:hypothetical protein